MHRRQRLGLPRWGRESLIDHEGWKGDSREGTGEALQKAKGGMAVAWMGGRASPELGDKKGGDCWS